ncbi:MAG TPA: polysaccharide pyruvyl transferase family protein [Blastocatellia bacterium]|jgi:polysaccharide pyruvyl transferase WcaK-like protein|nr:polysaccharide pyruvyl transferase family protein [Blastocatellia bacterium]
MSMDLALEAWVSGLVEVTRLGWMMGAGKRWEPGEKLKLLFAGYNGTRNTGSDVRVEEMLRQVRHILGDDKVQLSVMSQNFDMTRGYFDKVNQVRLPDIFPPFLYREVRKYDGVVACEGSMFKSKFANALTTMMIGSLAIASSQNKLSVGYGAEAGYMDPLIAKMCKRYCADSLVITRNEESQAVLGKLGVSTELGTDTAWTFEAHPDEYGAKVLREAGWDGSAPVLVVCPINPFWWPVKASVAKAAARTLTGAYKESHYRSVYFHNSKPSVVTAYDGYLRAMSNAVDRFRRERGVFVILVAMEALDTRACNRMSEQLGGVPIFSSCDYDMYKLVSILRSCHLMVSSRYHGIVTAMPALVASAGVTMDERIRNLMHERGHEELLLNVDDPDLEEKLLVVMDRLQKESESIRVGIGQTVAKNLKAMARMGVYFEEHVQKRYPEFPIRKGVLSWEDYLPPLSANLNRLVETYG